MRIVALYLTIILGLSLAEPNGYYHQEYNYKASSAAYRNNELQHSKNDEGYYSRDGDFEGRLKPKINAHSQHSEYVNPKYRDEYQQGLDQISMGHLAGDNSRQYRGTDTLQTLTQRLESELSRELQQAINNQHRLTSSYGSISSIQTQHDLRNLENELRNNMTMKLQEALNSQYGKQAIKDSMSYSITGGRLSPYANYNNNELTQLKDQMENNLLRRLQDEVRTIYSSHSSSMSSHLTKHYGQTVDYSNRPTTTYEKLYPDLDNLNQYNDRYQNNNNNNNNNNNRPYSTSRPNSYPSSYSGYSTPDSQVYSSSKHHYSSSVTATTIATRVQDLLNNRLNDVLEDIGKEHFSPNSHTNTQRLDIILSQLEQDLKNNVTEEFENEIRRNYGSSHNNQYNRDDLDSLKNQIENNLLSKLKRDFNRQKDRYFETSHQTQYSIKGGGSSYRNYENQPFPIHGQQLSTTVNHIKSNMNNQHGSYKSYETQPYPGHEQQLPAGLSFMQDKLQKELTKQLQAALIKNTIHQTQLLPISSSSFSPQKIYEDNLKKLSAELNRNLTDQLEQSLSQYYSKSSSTFGNYNNVLSNIRTKLQDDLQKQLQNGLQQSYSQFSSWSSSSSSSSSSNSNYRPTRGSFSHMEELMNGEDCNLHQHSYRRKRSNFNHPYINRYHNPPIEQIDVKSFSQQLDNEDEILTQKSENIPDQFDLIQKTESTTHSLQTTETVTTKPIRYNRLRIISHYRPKTTTRPQQTQQEDDDSDLTKNSEVEDLTVKPSLSKLEDEINQKPIGQELDDSDLTQQIIDDSELLHKPKPYEFQRVRQFRQKSQHIQQSLDNIQRIDAPENGFEQLIIGNQQNPLSEQDNNYFHLYPKISENHPQQNTFESLTVGNHQKPNELNQHKQIIEMINQDTVQRSQPLNFETIESKPIRQDISQQILETNHHKKPLSYHSKPINSNSENLNQQVQSNDDLRKLSIQDLSQQHIEINHPEPNIQRRPFLGNFKLTNQEDLNLNQQVQSNHNLSKPVNQDLTQQILETGDSRRNYHRRPYLSHYKPLIQTSDNSNLNQQVELSEDLREPIRETEMYQRPLTNGHSLHQDSDLTQHVEQIENSNLFQQKQENDFQTTEKNFNIQKPNYLANSNLIQLQKPKHTFGKLYHNIERGQQIDDSDLVQQKQDITDTDMIQQQNEDDSFGKLQLLSHSQGKPQIEPDLTQQKIQKVVDSDIYQQSEDDSYGNLEIGSQSQQLENMDIIQQSKQIEDDNFGKLQIISQSQNNLQKSSEQQIDNLDLVQKVQPLGQQIDDSDLVQKVQHVGQQIDDSDLIQKQDDSIESRPGHQHIQTIPHRNNNYNRQPYTYSSYTERPYQINEPIENSQLPQTYANLPNYENEDYETASKRAELMVEKLKKFIERRQKGLQQELEIVPEITTIVIEELSTEKPGFWKRIGNKIKEKMG